MKAKSLTPGVKDLLVNGRELAIRENNQSVVAWKQVVTEFRRKSKPFR